MQDASKLVVANWKMNLDAGQSLACLAEISQRIKPSTATEVVLCPTFLSLLAFRAKNQAGFKLGAQNCNANDEGSLTGEVSVAFLKELVEYVIVGHSERRRYFFETDTDVNQKMLACLGHGLKPIVCIGESLNQRKSGETETTLRNQIDGALQKIDVRELGNLVIAYEPVWAIGSAKTPTDSELNLSIHTIKTQLGYMFGSAGDSVRLLYGGSVDDKNAQELLNVRGVDGLLVGKASLNIDKFATIVKVAEGSGND
jgi:triosephosphate isomerase